MTKHVMVVVLVGIILVAAQGSAPAVQSPEQKCATAKLKAAAKGVSGQMTCHGKAKGRSEPVDSACVAKAVTKATAAVVKAGDACPGDAAAVGSAIESCVVALLADVPGDGKCPSRSAKTAGRGSAADLVCHAKLVAKAGKFEECQTKSDAKTTAALAKDGGCADADTLADVHECSSVLDPLIKGCPDEEAGSTDDAGATPVAATPAACRAACASLGCGGYIFGVVCECYLNAGWKWCLASFCPAATATRCSRTACP